MLVLSRRPGEKVVLPSLGVTIEVIPSKGSSVRLGIDAPRDVLILRDEAVGRPSRMPAGESPSPRTSAASRQEFNVGSI